MTKPIASLSLDLDNKWSYLKTHGDPGWEDFPSYLDLVVPRVLRFLAQRDLTITFFVVGQDAALEKNHQAIASIAEAGHEIGNHSFHHEPWLHLYSEQQTAAELCSAEEQLLRVTGQRPRGFRGPGYSLSRETLRVLVDRGYEYDASTFPTFLGPLARFYYLWSTKLNRGQKRQRQELFGRFSDGLKPLKPHWRSLDNGHILEMPVTTMPLLRTPIHASYLLYLSSFSRAAARSYFRLALALCGWFKVEPSLLLHPLDFLGCEDESQLSFFPAMGLPSRRKIALLSDIADLLSHRHQVATLREHARAAADRIGPRLPAPVSGRA